MTQAPPAAEATASGTPQPTLRILETRVLRGPNLWSRTPVIRMLVDLGVLEQWPSNMIPDFNRALIALLPGLDSPTVLPLARTGMHAVHAVVDRRQVVELLGPLRSAGASSILVLPIENLVP